MATNFDSVFAFQASRPTAGGPADDLTLERLANNKRRGVKTDFVIDNNLLINIDDACDSIDSVSDEVLREKKLYGWVAFLRECERQGLDYGLTPGFGYSEMPEELAKLRAGRLGKNLRKLGLSWQHDDSPADYAGFGLAGNTLRRLGRESAACNGDLFCLVNGDARRQAPGSGV